MNWEVRPEVSGDWIAGRDKVPVWPEIRCEGHYGFLCVTYQDGTIRHFNMLNELSRQNGPAVELPDGTQEYWIDGRQLSWEEYRNSFRRPP
jgi:hypothetical protein